MATVQKVNEALVEAWQRYVEMHKQDPQVHPDDLNDFRFHIHALQNLLAANSYWKEHPEQSSYRTSFGVVPANIERE